MSATIERTWQVNGVQRKVAFPPLARLLEVLRNDLDLKSIKEGCGEGECGACSVVLADSELQLACLIAAAQLEDGTSILTSEGLQRLPLGQILTRCFGNLGAVQCGYCSPGMLLGSYALLAHNPVPSEEEIRVGLAGHLCRCTGYSSIIQAVQAASEEYNA